MGRAARKLVGDNTYYLAANIITMLVSLFRGFYIARSLEPATYGIWNALTLILSYNKLGQAGFLEAFDREYPFHLGKGDHQHAEAVKNTAFSAIMISTLDVSLPLLVLSFWPQLPPVAVFGLRVFALIVIMDQLFEFYIDFLRTKRNFRRLSLMRTAFPIANLLLVVPLVYFFQLEGLIWSYFACFLLIALAIQVEIRSNVRPSLDLGLAWSLLRSGFPLLVNIILYTILITVDRILILRFEGTESLGYYGVAAVFMGFIQAVPAGLSYVIYPHLLDRYGREGQIAALRRHVFYSLELLAILLPLAIASLWILTPLLFIYLLPKYAPATDVLRILLVGVFSQGLYLVAGSFLNSIYQQQKVFYLLLGSMLLGVTSTYLALTLGWGIRGVAGAMAVTHSVYGLSAAVWAYAYFLKDKWEVLKRGLGNYLFFAICMMAAIVLGGFFLVDSDLGLLANLRNTAFQLLGVSIFAGALLLLWRDRLEVFVELLPALRRGRP